MNYIASLDQANASNEHEIALLYDRYAAPLYGIILRSVKSEADAESILQRAFLLICDDINTQTNTTPPFTKLISIARKLILTHNQNENALKKECADSLAVATLLQSEFHWMEGMCVTSRNVFRHVCLENRTLLETSLLLNISLIEARVFLRTSLQVVSSTVKVTTPVIALALPISLITEYPEMMIA